jgi:acyl carrier protein
MTPSPTDDAMSPIGDALRSILESAVGRRALPSPLTDDTPLLGTLPELDSMAVLTILTQLQEELGCEVADDEVEADLFRTFGSLRRFVESKLG